MNDERNENAGDVDVIVPSWNGRALLERCLPTLLAQTAPCRLVVVDNGSADGTDELVRQRFPEASLVALADNRGFAVAVNRGIAAGEAPYVVLVNNDVECDPRFVERIVGALHRDPGAGMAAGLLLKPGRAVIDGYGLEFDRTLAAFARFAGASFPGTELHDRHLAGPSGGAAAFRRAALDQVGGFDERIFAYMEDADLALRMRSAGWSCAGAPEALGVHLGSATIGRRSRAQAELAGFARAYMLRKYGVLRRAGRAAQALTTELGVATLETAIGRDVAALRGRRRGWRAARGRLVEAPSEAINPEIGFGEALRRRWAALRSG